ncbi:hypothetical protein dsx2_2109 [Desulfovibrio sp. X2]|uniref:class I SAM-dependent methyltransferase n=1 Tax=Desulfovibrio sp. X2 TaxID=941449 RepID=UPI0003586F7E|nr:class I SAM-dependent methyltransferase [Desulfovibrio sp. X2]EPR43682.1 hypothetical protein dsx2_2109 [Desulfovibrio sp. X2]
MKDLPLEKIAALQQRGALLFIDDPYPFQPTQRWGYGKPAHPELTSLLRAQHENYLSFLDMLVSLAPHFAAIPLDAPEESAEPRWNNTWLPILDGMSIYTTVATHKPRRFIEVGSGNSTKFAARAIRDHGLQTQIFSIDPTPRSEIDGLCHRSLRLSLETLDSSFFRQTTAEDVVFVDCSHRAMQNSDATVFFLEVLPKLPVGCRIGIHDIFLPWDYPPGWEKRYYNEQYLLACALLFGSGAFEVQLPSYYVSITPEFDAPLAPLRKLPWMQEGRPVMGGIFWMRKRSA